MPIGFSGFPAIPRIATGGKRHMAILGVLFLKEIYSLTELREFAAYRKKYRYQHKRKKESDFAKR